MTYDEELFWRTQSPEAIDAEMERRLTAYFAKQPKREVDTNPVTRVGRCRGKCVFIEANEVSLRCTNCKHVVIKPEGWKENRVSRIA